MKIGSLLDATEPLPVLPVEIVEQILSYINLSRDVQVRQYTLWACCLLSRSWYDSSVKALYRGPHLTGRNFDRFSKTICPPVQSRSRAIGLENLVVDLDMGTLAYESTKSLTARLLRRTRRSLESFVAPAVSFSLAGLAPLSKSPQLRSLDLSNDYYNINVTELLRSIRDIENLEYLSLPRSALHTTSLSISRFAFRWPPNLTHLQINGTLPDSVQGWEGLIESFPDGLDVLSFQYLRNHSPFEHLISCPAKARQVRRILVGEPARETMLQLRGILEVFPNTSALKIPLSSWDPQELDTWNVGRYLERLSLCEGLFRRPVQPMQLLSFAEALQNLRRIEMPEHCLQVIENIHVEHLQELQGLLLRRQTSRSGIDTGFFVSRNQKVIPGATDHWRAAT